MSKIEESLLCRAGAVDLGDRVTDGLMYMPGGEQEITPIAGGIGKPIRVMVDRAGAEALEAQRRAIKAKGRWAYFDFNHEDGAASFWPTAFYWSESPVPGIYCRGTWSALVADWERWGAVAAHGAQLFGQRDPALRPMAGDIVIFTFSHMGIVEKPGEGLVHTIEGNTDDAGSREGRQVCRRERSLGACKKFIRLACRGERVS